MAKKSTKLKIRPLHDRIVVRPGSQEQTSAGGIVIPDTAAEKPARGEVIAVGQGKVLDNGKRLAPDVKVGDSILYGKYAGTEIKVGNEELLVMREDDVMAVVMK